MSNAIVIGGSISGLVSARVLLNHFDSVALIERDQLPEYPAVRPGVPQASHVHGLLLKGHQLLEQLFPGLTQDLLARGAQLLDWGRDWQWLTAWGWFPDRYLGLESLICSRLLLEWYLRERLFEADNFFLKDNCKVESLLHSNDAITGVAIQNKNANRIDSLNADLVVDASGRDSRLPNWLENSGYNTVPQSKVNSFLGYASRWYKIPNGFPNKGIIINSTPSINRRSGVLYPVEGKHWIVTLGGFEGDYPTADETEFLAFAKTLRDPKIYEAISSAEPISPIRCYRRTENCWHHYEALSAMPEGIVAVGDAVCTFNPIYGQGMTVAALGAKTLDNCLNRMASTEKGFSLRFQRQLAKLVKTPWLMATGEDFRWPATDGKRPGWFSQKVQRYFDRITQLATHDTKVLQNFIEVAHLRKSPMNLFTPSILWKVATQFQMKQSKG